ncbi:ATP-binding cassette domain-containing protein [Saccharopolyspora hattusasensis]|uniref:ATP-binding cassette domain-containing protein n=1 Tax=Saccharopolyspora hattusasensis TaxID=1128679 RepID=UPI003D956E6B
MTELLTVDNLSVESPSGARILDGVSLSIGEGEVLAVVGESGSGKSMTAMSLIRLLPTPLTASADGMALAGQDLLRATDKEMNSIRGGRIGALFQSTAWRSASCAARNASC